MVVTAGTVVTAEKWAASHVADVARLGLVIPRREVASFELVACRCVDELPYWGDQDVVQYA